MIILLIEVSLLASVSIIIHATTSLAEKSGFRILPRILEKGETYDEIITRLRKEYKEGITRSI
jgi:hypothetical protein